MTEREGDLQDCMVLNMHKLNWDIILDELKEQIKTSGRKVTLKSNYHADRIMPAASVAAW